MVPRVSETDGAGHINNTVIPVWFEAGRDEIFQMFTPDLQFSDWKCVILSMNVQYKHQIYYGIPVTVRTWIQRIGTSSFDIYEVILQNDILCAEGISTYVNFNFIHQKTEPIPDAIKRQLIQHVKD
ncbi:acyl-CoA thioesterase [Alteribacillus sp. HJP-4]|uniref:acyl-CoA thioesterase n=1 Tax=Alteribacillus sp. HJP-4 TaxID=2775394 RepID=UPI0035CCDBD4